MKSIKFLAAVSAMAFAMPATAATLYSLGNTGALVNPSSFNFSAAAGAGAGSLSFNLDGYLTLDGVNGYDDVFTLTINGSNVLQLSYDLGGGGSNSVILNSNGATITGGTFGFNQGGQLQIALPVTLLNGNNTFSFSYAAPGALNNGGQSTGDEAWGLNQLTLSGNAPATNGAVPEPASWAMMIAGFGLVSMAMRRKQSVSVRYA